MKKNNLIKKAIVLLTILTLLSSLFSSVVFASGDIKVLLNGTSIAFDVPPQIIDGRTMVPMRAVFEALGAEVYWDDSAKSVTALKGSTEIELNIGEKFLRKNNEGFSLDVAPQIINGRTLVPVRAVAESFDCVVLWNDLSKTVLITSINDTSNNNVLKFYNNTKIPTFDTATDAALIRTIDDEPIAGFQKTIYEYNYDINYETKYVDVLKQHGFEEIQNIDEFRLFGNTSTMERVILQGANGGDGTGVIWIRISNSNTFPVEKSSPFNILKNEIINKGVKTDDGVYGFTHAIDSKSTCAIMYYPENNTIRFVNIYTSGGEKYTTAILISPDSTFFDYTIYWDNIMTDARMTAEGIMERSIFTPDMQYIYYYETVDVPSYLTDWINKSGATQLHLALLCTNVTLIEKGCSILTEDLGFVSQLGN